MQSKKRALGKGLAALLPPKPTAEPAVAVIETVPAPAETETFDGARLQRLPINLVKPNPFQPRLQFNEAALAELAASIRDRGVIQPVIVTRRNDSFMLVAGERRWRASQQAGVATVPAIELNLNDQEVLEYGLIENLQRENLNPMEEARAYKALIDNFGLSQDEVADRVEKSRPAVANSLRLLKLSSEFQADIESGALSAGHARALLSIENEVERKRLRDAIIRDGLSVREAEQFALKSANRPKRARVAKAVDPNVKSLREQFEDHLACRVTVKTFDANRGKIEIFFTSLDELERIKAAMGVPEL
jgi:ParB family chromosome partitioning protein